MQTLRQIRQVVEEAVRGYARPRSPEGLYGPAGYIMGLGGKRIRPVLCALGYALFDGRFPDRLWSACLAMEVFHGFSLVHDDIMDEAPLRRGQPSVHVRWDVPTAILAGDVMLIEVYDLLRRACLPDQLDLVLQAFHRVATGVCEGQAMDMAFERESAVAWDEYLSMIRGKTAVLLGGSLEIGALLAGADPLSARETGRVGEDLGLGFQLEDDWLDVFGDSERTGKQPGGDILRGKKTALYILAMLQGSTDQKNDLETWFGRSPSDEKVRAVSAIYSETGAAAAVLERSEAFFRSADDRLDRLPVRKEGCDLLRELTLTLQGRKA